MELFLIKGFNQRSNHNKHVCTNDFFPSKYDGKSQGLLSYLFIGLYKKNTTSCTEQSHILHFIMLLKLVMFPSLRKWFYMPLEFIRVHLSSLLLF